MIISASRRTDLPAFYAPWLLNRARAGWCAVPNPFNPLQVSRVSLRPQDVDALVFWTRWPAPLTARLRELEALGLKRSLFLITLLDSPRCLEPRQIPLRKRLAAFTELADRIGPERVSWRYDPIVISSATPADWHERTFARLARTLRHKTRRCIVSVLDDYKKIRPRLRLLRSQGLEIPADQKRLAAPLLPRLAMIAAENGMVLQTCCQAEPAPASVPVSEFMHGAGPEADVRPGACISAPLLNGLFGLSLPPATDPHQRAHCRCVPSRDIGMYDSCAFGCAYCYATTDFARSRANRAAHDPESPSLLGHISPSAGQQPPTQRTGQARLPGLETPPSD